MGIKIDFSPYELQALENFLQDNINENSIPDEYSSYPLLLAFTKIIKTRKNHFEILIED